MPLLGATGGNTEPMTFRRSFGATVPPPPPPQPPQPHPSQIYGAQPPPPPPPPEESNGKEEEDTPKKHKRDRSRDRKERKKRSRSRDRKKRSRSRSRDRRKRSKRSRSRSRKRSSSRTRKRSTRSRDRSAERKSRFDIKKEDESYNAALMSSNLHAQQQQSQPFKFQMPTPHAPIQFNIKSEPQDLNPAGRKRRSRWGNEADKCQVPGMPTTIPSNLSEDQQRAYLLQIQIEETSRKLRAGGNLGIDPDPFKRSPSPEPVYDSHGKRLNTREVRTRQKLEQERHDYVTEMIKINPMYKPPQDYKAPVIRLHDKVWIPQDDHPEINFVGLLIGPRGNTLKSLERETGAKIIIRGKGSVKEGKVKKEGPLPGEDEPLHAYITATDPATIQKASLKIKTILDEALEVPESQNELRKLQLRELAVLNGTLRPEDLVSGNRCSNCGDNTHKSWECPNAPNVTANIFCTKCGGAGHISKDCKDAAPGLAGGIFPGAAGGLGASGGTELDEEYSALMAELGQDPGAGNKFGSIRMPGMPQTIGKRPEPIMRVNLVQNRPKPPSLMSINIGGPTPWGMPPPPPQGDDDAAPPNAPSGPSAGYNNMFGPPPPPPPMGGKADHPKQPGPPPPLMGFPPMNMMGWGMPGAMAPPPPPPPAPVPPPPSSSAGQGSLDLSALLTAPAPPPPPPPPM